jgi:hypothetical protein
VQFQRLICSCGWTGWPQFASLYLMTAERLAGVGNRPAAGKCNCLQRVVVMVVVAAGGAAACSACW